MTTIKYLSISTLTASLVILAGCTLQPTTESASGENTNVVTNTNTTNDNANVKVVTNTNDSNVNTDIDTSDWLTYTNEEYGFSFRYPADTLVFAQCQNLEDCAFNIQNIKDIPEERTEENPFLRMTRGEAIEEREYIAAENNNENVIVLPSGLRVRKKIDRGEGGGIVTKYVWYDNENQYYLQMVFPTTGETWDNFFETYDTTKKINTFIEDVLLGFAPKKYQKIFNEFDKIVNTLTEI